jgi:hypothetical protein
MGPGVGLACARDEDAVGPEQRCRTSPRTTREERGGPTRGAEAGSRGAVGMCGLLFHRHRRDPGPPSETPTWLLITPLAAPHGRGNPGPAPGGPRAQLMTSASVSTWADRTSGSVASGCPTTSGRRSASSGQVRGPPDERRPPAGSGAQPAVVREGPRASALVPPQLPGRAPPASCTDAPPCSWRLPGRSPACPR